MEAWRQADAANKRIQELEAQCAAMREALEDIRRGTRCERGSGYGYEASFDWLHDRATAAISATEPKEGT